MDERRSVKWIGLCRGRHRTAPVELVVRAVVMAGVEWRLTRWLLPPQHNTINESDCHHCSRPVLYIPGYTSKTKTKTKSAFQHSYSTKNLACWVLSHFFVFCSFPQNNSITCWLLAVSVFDFLTFTCWLPYYFDRRCYVRPRSLDQHITSIRTEINRTLHDKASQALFYISFNSWDGITRAQA